jgi:hypothetical protein
MAEITYLMDADPAGAANAFFGNAKGYFLATKSVVVDAPAGGQTLEEVFDDLRKRADTGPAGIFEVINLVAHATGFSSLMFGLTKAERGHILTAGRLTNALATSASSAPILKRLGPPAVTAKTRVRLFGCDVGKDSAFLRNVGLMFGEPADVAAPLRVAVFRHAGASFIHRLARTWAVPWPSDIAATPSANWSAVRTSFIAKAESKFGQVADERNPNDIFARDAVKATITTAANPATAGTSATFFFHEYFELPIPPGEANPQAFVNTVKPQSSATVTATEISDLSVPSRVGPADFTDKSNPSLWIAHVAVLAEVIDQPVSLGDSGQYRTVAIAPTTTPSPGPKAVGDAGVLPPPVPPPADTLWQQVSAAFVLAGGAQGDLDALVAGLDAPATDQELSEPELPVLTDADAPVALVEEGEA